ncbi:C2 domain-containing protein 2 [Amia ocellicauda]|uniref:C2 domain-containing protein 2 n=1 Tax=Amia ocellicauda TaxID=2972642 RepID=UPI003463D123
MSVLESVLADFAPGELQWLGLVTLFVASVVTVLVYLVQWALGPGGRAADRAEPGAFSAEADALLSWALALRSWRCEWQSAWCRALNDQARRTGGPLHFTFQEDGLQPSKLAVSQVSSYTKSAEHKNVCCQVSGDSLQFSLRVTQRTAAPTDRQSFTVTISPLQMQLELQMKEAVGKVHISWTLLHLEAWHLRVTPSSRQEQAPGLPSVAAVRSRVQEILCAARPSVLLSGRPAQGTDLKEMRNKGPATQVTSPPKPPRAHDWRLLVKNIKATCEPGSSAAGSINPYCVLQLDDPPQKLSSLVLKNTSNPSWDQPFVFELSGKSKELKIQLLDEGKPQESSLLGRVSVPFDLFKKHPNGQQVFALKTEDQVTGSLSAEFTYLDPSEVRSWQPPTVVPAKKVEMDRTVMPCGTVVTTVTAVKSKPGRSPPSALSTDSPMKGPSKAKLGERRVSEQPVSGTMVSKALSSSDTELLMLNGTDPVAEAAIRQLHESAKQKLKSPVKKSTIIISGVAKTPLSQDDEMALMAGYAAAMDASMTQDLQSEVAAPPVSAPAVCAAELELMDLQEGPSGTPSLGEWEARSAQDPDTEKKSELSLSVSEPGAIKKGKGGFLHKSAKLFFRRRHQRKEPGMSQSHNDLVYLEHPVAVDKERRTATLSRIINKKLLPKSKSKSKANGTTMDPHA